MAKISVFPVVENLVKGEVPFYGFVPPEASPPYIVYKQRDETWGFPEIHKGTIAFRLKVVSTYKGSQEIHRLVALLKEKLEGREMSYEPHSKGLFQFIYQDIILNDDAITHEALLDFRLLVRRMSDKRNSSKA